MVTKTNDYSIFKIIDCNRDIKEKKVLKLMRSLKGKNLLRSRPILVDKDLNIMDGQHRLEAAKRLNLPVWYEVEAGLTPEDIIRLNDNQSFWDNNDYLKFYVEKGNVEYIKLKRFLEDHKISIATAYAIFGLKPTSGRAKQIGDEEPNPFKAGKFVFPTSAEQLEAIEVLNRSKEIIEYIKPKVQGHNNKYLEGPHFRRALYLFLSIKAVDHQEFMKKLAQRLDLIRPCSRISEFVNILKQIYNFKNRNPVTLDEFA